MSYLPQRPALGAVPAWGIGAAIVAIGAVYFLWDGLGSNRRKSWLRYETKHRRACDLSRRRAPKAPLSQITC